MSKVLTPQSPVSSGMKHYILRCLLEGMNSPYRIGKRLGKDKNTVKYHLGRLESLGAVIFDCHSWIITESGKEMYLGVENGKSGQGTGQYHPSPVASGSSGTLYARGSSGNEAGEKRGKVDSVTGGVTGQFFGVSGQVRLHKVWLNFGVQHSFIMPAEKVVKLKSGASYSDVKIADGLVRLWSNGRILASLPAFWGKTVEDAERSMKKWIIDWIPLAQDKLGFKIIQDGEVQNWKVTQGEVAFVNHEFAKKCRAKKLTIQVRGQDGKVWLLVDASLGDAEIDTVSPKAHVQDAQLVEGFFNDVRTGRWKDLQVGLALQGEVMKSFTLQQQILVVKAKERGWFE